MVSLRDIFAGGDKKKNKRPLDEPEIPAGLSEEELKYYYRNPDGTIFTPLYEIQNELYTRAMVKSIKIETSYRAFQDTSWMERYTTNIYQFSAAKSITMARRMAAEVYTPEGQLRSWPQFRDAANSIQTTANEVWLRVERDNCARQAILADKYTDMRADADMYPYWIYVGRMDSRERPEHVALEGLIFRIGDRYGDMMFPPSDWNCRCTGRPIDDLYLRDRRRVVQTNQQAKGWLEGVDKDTGKPFVDPQFRYNPADQGMMPRVGDYFYEVPNANAFKAPLFGGVGGPENPNLHASPLESLSDHMKEWRGIYHVDHLGNICFQNDELLSNVWFTAHSANKVHGHPRGVGMLPETITDPAEVWARWDGVDEQMNVLRNYLTYTEKNAYVVQTRNGGIQDAFLISKPQAEKYRVGVPWLK